MNILLAVIGGLIVGAGLTWLLAGSYYRNFYSARIAEAERQASGFEGSLSELRKQMEETTFDFNRLRQEKDQLSEAKVRAETRLREVQERLEEEKKLLMEAKAELTNTFKALAGDTLAKSNQEFLSLAQETFNKILNDAKGDLGQQRISMEGLVKPLAESLKRIDEHNRSLEKNRQEAYSSLDEQVKSMAETQQRLQKETNNLVTALRRPEVRGRWGEMTLKRVVEMAGLSKYCDFTEQLTVTTDNGRLRPDMVINLPSERKIVVDVKVSLDAYLTAVDAETTEQREEALNHHARQLKAHITSLGAKAYWDQFDRAPEFVVMFIPVESCFVSALERDPELIELGVRQKVFLTTPATLIALLRTVAYGWREEQIARNAQEISNLGKRLYERMRTLSNHIVELGKGLEKANKSYNKAVGSIESKVLVAARRFKELGAASGDDIQTIPPVEVTPRTLSIPELTEETQEINLKENHLCQDE